MIKIGYYLQNKNIIPKILELSTFDATFLLYELKKGNEQEVKDLKIDCMIFDFNGEDISKLESFEKIKENLKIRGICILEEYSDSMIEMVIQHKIQYICEPRQSAKGFYVMILQMLNEHRSMKLSLHDKIEEIMKSHDLSFHLSGTNYLYTAILYYIENENKTFRMKDVYDTIAKKYHTTSSRVEKNMRMAINDCGSPLSNAKFVGVCYKEWQNG